MKANLKEEILFDFNDKWNSIKNLAQCDSHGYMCQDCQQSPEELKEQIRDFISSAITRTVEECKEEWMLKGANIVYGKLETEGLGSPYDGFVMDKIKDISQVKSNLEK